ncbi:MAG TPA: HAD-IA family hydrolase [Myxococcales bacterium]|jgi:phosphoglycolate phosphatase
MRNLPRLRLVVYDLDGTLIDSRADLADSVNAMLARMDLPTHEQRVVIGFVGEGAERLIRRSLGPQHEHRYSEAAPIWAEEYGARLLHKTKLYDGIDELLQLPPELRAVLTNKPGRFAREILQGLGVAKSFARVVGGDEGPRKPSPDWLLRLCRELHADAAETLLVGDSAVDVSTGKAAGVPICAVTYGMGERASLTAADYLCDTPAQVAELLQKLAS